MKYCTYARPTGILGWLMGWTLVGISEKPVIGGYGMEFLGRGYKLLLLEMEPPLAQNFRFIPKGAKKLHKCNVLVLDRLP